MPLFCDSPLSLFILHLQSPSSSLPSQGCSQSFPILWRCLVLLLIFLLPESPQKICLIFFPALILFFLCCFYLLPLSFRWSHFQDVCDVPYHTCIYRQRGGRRGQSDKGTHPKAFSYICSPGFPPSSALVSHLMTFCMLCELKTGSKAKDCFFCCKSFCSDPLYIVVFKILLMSNSNINS